MPTEEKLPERGQGPQTVGGRAEKNDTETPVLYRFPFTLRIISV